MKKLLLITILILGLSTISVYAQEELPTEKGGEEVQIQIQEDQSAPDEDVDLEVQDESPSDEAEDSKTLSDELQVTPESNISLLTILFAILTPLLLVVLAYLLIKMANN